MVNTGKLNLLIVESNALIRQTFSQYFENSAKFNLICAALDIKIAMAKSSNIIPDIIVFDCDNNNHEHIALMKKNYGGLGVPILFFSVKSELEVSETANLLGCMDWKKITKPSQNLASETIRLIPDVEIALKSLILSARMRLNNIKGENSILQKTKDLKSNVILTSTSNRLKQSQNLICLGASTGGTTALLKILSVLPETIPGLLIVIHMPPSFTGAFAERLNQLCNIEVIEAQNNQEVKRGQAIIARGDRHLEIRQTSKGFVTICQGKELNNGHCPSVDVLFDSVAKEAGSSATGILLTGMGKDGALGLSKIRNCGGNTIAQDEKSSVVFGMAKNALALGAVQQLLTLDDIPVVLIEKYCAG